MTIVGGNIRLGHDRKSPVRGEATRQYEEGLSDALLFNFEPQPYCQADQGSAPGGGEGRAPLHNLDTCGRSERGVGGLSRERTWNVGCRLMVAAS